MLTWPLARALLWPQPVWLLQCLWATRWVALGKNWITDSFWPPVGNQSQSRQNLHRMWLPIFGLWFPVLHTTLLPFSIDAGPLYDFYTYQLQRQLHSLEDSSQFSWVSYGELVGKGREGKHFHVIYRHICTAIPFLLNQTCNITEAEQSGWISLGGKCVGHFCAGKKF